MAETKQPEPLPSHKQDREDQEDIQVLDFKLFPLQGTCSKNRKPVGHFPNLKLLANFGVDSSPPCDHDDDTSDSDASNDTSNSTSISSDESATSSIPSLVSSSARLQSPPTFNHLSQHGEKVTCKDHIQHESKLPPNEILQCKDMEKGSTDDLLHCEEKLAPFVEEKWNLRYKELLEFLKVNGHVNVPHSYPENQQLARWVKRQRRQYKLLKDGKHSAMTLERIEVLNSTGFIWDSHDLTWREKIDSLKEFRRKHGHCNVGTKYDEKKLGTWVKCQRRQYKLYRDGKPSAMDSNRVQELEGMGFEWEIRRR